MDRLGLLLSFAVMLCAQNAFARNRVTDPIKMLGNARVNWSSCARRLVLEVSE